MDTKLVLSLVLLQVAGLTSAQNVCNNASVVACVQTMQQFELDEYDAIVPTWDEQQLDTLCEHYQQTSTCLNRLINNCSRYDQYYFRAVEDSWDYICIREKDAYLGHRECLARPTLHANAQRQCTQVWEERVESLNRNKFRHVSGNLNDAGLSSLCNFANDYLSCVYTSVEAECDEAAANWQRGFDDTLIQPLLRLVGCTQSRDNQGQTFYSYSSDKAKGVDESIIIIVAVAIALGVLVMVIIAIVLIRKRKRSDPMMHNEPAPPYVVYGADVQSVSMGGAMGPVMAAPSYKEKGDLGPEFGIPMPPPPSTYGAPPSYRPAESVYQGGHGAPSVMSGRTNRTSRSHHSQGSRHPSQGGRMSSNASGYMNPSSGYI